MADKKNRPLLAFLALLIIFGGVYITGQNQIKKSINQIEMEYTSFNVDTFSLLPPKIDITLTYIVENPSELPLNIKVDGDVFYGDKIITPVFIEERLIPAQGNGEVDMKISLNGSILQAIGNPENESGYRLEGILTVVGQYLGVIPVKVNLELTDLINEN